MEIDLKRNGKKVEYLSTEKSSQFDVNKLEGVKRVESVYLMKESDSSLSRVSESELKTYFTKNKNELIKILNEAILVNKKDYEEENNKFVSDTINELFNNEFGSYNVVKYVGHVESLPETSKSGEIYSITEGSQINYYIYLNNGYFALMGKDYFEQNYYNKEVLNLKLEDLNSKLNEMIKSVDLTEKNAISKDDLDAYLLKLEELKEKLSSISNN